MQVHDPQGVAVSYLLGGAQYVVANMWDVTDKDIDKLSMECMRLCFGNDEDVSSIAATNTSTTSSSSIHSDVGLPPQSTGSAALLPAEALAASREMCKLKNAVGCAPVIYGLPRRTHNQ
jgi:separase